LNEHDEAVFEGDEIEKMDKQEPSGIALKTELSEESDRLRAADYSEIASLAVAEGRERAAVETSLDGARHVATLLHTFFWCLSTARSGDAMSAGDSPPVAT